MLKVFALVGLVFEICTIELSFCFVHLIGKEQRLIQ